MPNYSESLPELLKRVAAAKSRNEKAEILKKGESLCLCGILQGAFDPNLKWNLPPGIPPYKQEVGEYGQCPSNLEMELRKLIYFIDGHPQMIPNQFRREKLFIDILESIHSSEAELLIQMKDKNIKVNGLTQLLISEIWPGLVPKPENKKEEVKA